VRCHTERELASERPGEVGAPAVFQREDPSGERLGVLTGREHPRETRRSCTAAPAAFAGADAKREEPRAALAAVAGEPANIESVLGAGLRSATEVPCARAVGDGPTTQPTDTGPDRVEQLARRAVRLGARARDTSGQATERAPRVAPSHRVLRAEVHGPLTARQPPR
jgi:hypothetical protein